MQFGVEPLFGLKCCLTINRSVQLFLQSCQDAFDINEVKICYLDFVFNHDCIKHGRFACVSPPPLLALFQDATPKGVNEDTSKSKKFHRNAL